LQNLEPFLLVGLFIAYERNKGKGSFWHPYLDMLPEQPECAWLMQPKQLISALAAAKKPLGDVCKESHTDWSDVPGFNHISACGLFIASVCCTAVYISKYFHRQLLTASYCYFVDHGVQVVLYLMK